ncbi:MAG TPA: hypothetical protein PK095_03595, partial [Myxococcota bacterium]|nr:hypothetical protein [Myxococcota bacterium]
RALWASSVLTVGCGVERSGSDEADLEARLDSEVAEVDDSVQGYAAPSCERRPDGQPLTPGRWASRQRSAAIVNLPPTNTPTTVVTTRLILHDVVREGGETRLTHTTCQLRQPKLNGVEVVFGPAFLGAVPKNTVVAGIDGAEVIIPPDLVVLGAEVQAGDELPTSADDARVRDSDEDGNPGVTVTLQGLLAGQLFVVYRQEVGLTGMADRAGCVAGLVAGASEQIQIGASPVELAQIDLSPRPHPDATLSTFSLVPVARDLDCAGLIATDLELFGPEPE